MLYLARYGGCNFEDKVRNAQEANFSAAIVYNINSNKLVPMGGDDDSLIPSVFIGYEDAGSHYIVIGMVKSYYFALFAEMLLHRFLYPANSQVYLLIQDDTPFDFNAYLLPFAIVVGICFLVMLVIVVYKCWQDHRRSRRHRLPKSALKKLPIVKFKVSNTNRNVMVYTITICPFPSSPAIPTRPA